jgi:ATP-binding protein involved in chromosome partitioning
MSSPQTQGQQKITPTFVLMNMARERLSKTKHKIMVLSGKGGVGKTFVSAMLSLALASKGYKVAILDADIHGSSIPTMLGIMGMRHTASENGIEPIIGPLGVKVVATNFLLETPDTPVIWRGPLVSKAITELLAKVNWGENDYLIIDLPPGTGDEAITVVQTIKDLDGAIVVTAPSILSEVIVAKAINFVIRNNNKLLGIVENMSYFRCPKCGTVYQLLGKSTGEELAKKYNTKLLAKIPIDPYIGEALDKGVPYLLAYPDGDAAKALMELADKVIELTEKKEQ